MQSILDRSNIWADEVNMEWKIDKSRAIKFPFRLSMKGEDLPNSDVVAYLGVSLRPQGVTDDKICERIHAAHSKLRTLARITRSWKTSLKQRRLFVKIFFYSLCDYLLPLQPLTQKVLDEAGQLEAACLKDILRMNLTRQKHQRATALCKVLSVRARRKRHMIKAVSKFYALADRDRATLRHQRNWETIS